VAERLPALLQLPREIVSRYELHYEELAAGFDKVIGYQRQGRMAEVRKQSRFALKSPGHLLVVAKKRLFECDNASQAFVQRPVDGAHATLPDHFQDSVSALKDAVWCEHLLSLSVSVCKSARIGQIRFRV
jgi:hypothetical protein